VRRSLSGEGLRESAPFPFGSSVSPPSVRPPVRACVRACRGAAAAAVLFAPSFVAPLIFRSVGKVPWRGRDPRPLRLRAPTSSAWVASISSSCPQRFLVQARNATCVASQSVVASAPLGSGSDRPASQKAWLKARARPLVFGSASRDSGIFLSSGWTSGTAGLDACRCRTCSVLA
jgi:hypothetical protein